MDRFNARFNRMFNKCWILRVLGAAGAGAAGADRAALSGVFLASLAIYPFLGLAFFPHTDAGQFTINLKVPTGTRIEVTDQYVAKVEDLIRQTVDPKDFKLVVSNIGVVPDFSSLYTTNAGPYTATVQVQLQEQHQRSSFDYMQQVQRDEKAVSGDSDVLLQRLDGGCDSECGHAGAHRRAGEQLQFDRRAMGLRRIWRRKFGVCRAWARSTFRRT